MEEMANGDGNGLQNAGISPKERLERIENMLTKIDDKLDTKANSSDLAVLDARLRDLELHGSVQAKELLIEAGSFEQRLRVLEGIGIDKLGPKLDTLATGLDSVRARIWMAVGGLSVVVLAINVAIAKGWF